MQLLSIDEVLKAVPFGKSKLYELVKAGEFPAPVNISPRRTAWLDTEIEEWIASRIAERNRVKNAGVG